MKHTQGPKIRQKIQHSQNKKLLDLVRTYYVVTV